MMGCTIVNYNIMARTSHAIVRDGHLSRLTLAMYWNTFIKIVFGGLSDPLLKERCRPPEGFFHSVKIMSKHVSSV